MKEYLNIAEAVALTYSKMYRCHSEDIRGEAMLEAFKCHKQGLSHYLTVFRVRKKVISYIKKEWKQDKTRVKKKSIIQYKIFTEVPDDLDYIKNHLNGEKHTITKREFKKLKERVRKGTIFLY